LRQVFKKNRYKLRLIGFKRLVGIGDIGGIIGDDFVSIMEMIVVGVFLF